MFKDYPSISNIGNPFKSKWVEAVNKSINLASEKNNFLSNNFYQTCSISRSSANMANCVRDLLKSNKE